MNARKLVQEKYDWTQIGSDFCKIVENITFSGLLPLEGLNRNGKSLQNGETLSR